MTCHSVKKHQVLFLTLLLSACETATVPIADGYGPNPQLPPPDPSLIPTVNGLQVVAFASNLDHPRWLHVLPNGDVLVAESNAPPKPEGGGGVRGWIMNQLMKRAGAGPVSANRITLLRDADGNGVAEVQSSFLEGLYSPFGMALVGNTLYVANADAVVKYPYTEGTTRISAMPEKVTDLPGGPINHHWTKNVIAAPDGRALYVTVGSNSNVGENGMDAEVDRAAILAVNPATGARTVFASGLRNPNGL